jgi:hypothetical protein
LDRTGVPIELVLLFSFFYVCFFVHSFLFVR